MSKTKVNQQIRKFIWPSSFKRLVQHGLIGFYLLLSTVVWAQPTDSIYTLQYEFATAARFFTTDQLQQCYVVTPDNEVIKYSNEGKLLFRFNNNRLGELAHVDVTDPFNVLLYYTEYFTVILLDRTLSQTGEYNLYDLDVVEVRSVGLSNDHNIWIYDDVVFKVKKINRNGQKLAESDDLSMVLGQRIQPNFIMERNNWVYVNDPEIGILQFDLFGQYVRTIDLLGLDRFQVHNKQLIYQQDNQLYAFHLEALTTKSIALPQNKTGKNNIQIQKDRMYIQEGELVSLFTY